MHGLVDHDGTRAVAVYAEDVVDGRGFVAAARALADAGKPVVLLSPGRSAAAARSAVSHTGSMTSPAQVVDAACADGGVRRVDNPTQMADLLEGLLGERRMPGRGRRRADRRRRARCDRGRRAGRGGPGDARARAGDPRRATRGRCGPSSTVTNPVDLAGAGDRDPIELRARGRRAARRRRGRRRADDRLLRRLLHASPAACATSSSPPRRRSPRACAAQSKPVVVHTIFPPARRAVLLRAAGIPVHRDVDRACAVLAGLVARPVPELAEPPRRRPRPVADTSYTAARALFAEAGVAFPRRAHGARRATRSPGRFGRDRLPGGAQGARARCTSPTPGESCSACADEASALAAYDDLVARLGPPAVSVEAMADLADGVEVIAGCVRDRDLRAGADGRARRRARRGVRRHRAARWRRSRRAVRASCCSRCAAAPLLLGARGRPPVDLDALAAAVSRRVPGRGGAPGAGRARGEPPAGTAGGRGGPRRAGRAGSGSASSGVDVAQVALVEAVDPRVLGREDAVVEGP